MFVRLVQRQGSGEAWGLCVDVFLLAVLFVPSVKVVVTHSMPKIGDGFPRFPLPRLYLNGTRDPLKDRSYNLLRVYMDTVDPSSSPLLPTYPRTPCPVVRTYHYLPCHNNPSSLSPSSLVTLTLCPRRSGKRVGELNKPVSSSRHGQSFSSSSP